MLLPGMNCSPRLWRGVADSLSAIGVEVCYGELHGLTVDACAAHLLARLPARFAVAGLSLGGVVAMALTRQAADRVLGLALLSTNPRPPTAAQRRSWDRDVALLRSGGSARQVQAGVLPLLLGADARSPNMTAEVLTMADEVGARRLEEQLAVQASRGDERPGLARLRVPTLVVAGGSDTMCPPDWHLEVQALAAHADRVVLEGVGHLSPLETPAAVAQHLAAWWGSLDVRQP